MSEGERTAAIPPDDLCAMATELLGGLRPYGYQLRVADALLNGRNVVLQAPTGAGKTKAALLPFLIAKRRKLPFADRLIYAVPLRTLASSLYEEARALAAASGSGLDVKLQTGDEAHDPFLEADIVFTTIDQVLSAYIGSPVSLPGRNANIVGAATIGSYLVFDEFHLLGPDRALSTAIDLARRLKGLSRVLLMSATVTARTAELICARTSAAFEQVRDDELAAMPSQRAKDRRFHIVGEPISAQAVLDRHQRRSIAVVNTVRRAQELYREIQALAAGRADAPTIRLLHSRFLREDRAATERWALDAFKEGSQAEGILVATQVIEVGLNLSAQALHTDLAPAAALFQRAGRCARFAGERGEVYVYALPTDDAGRPRYAPYAESAEERLAVDRTPGEIARRAEGHFGYAHERAVVEATYGEIEARMLNQVQPVEFAGRVEAAMADQSVSAPRALIRDADSVAVAVHHNPVDIPGRERLQSFTLERGSFYAFAKRVLGRNEKLWILTESTVGDGPSVPIWQEVVGDRSPVGILWACVSPASAKYTPEAGLELDLPGSWCSSPLPIPERDLTYRYRRESYAEHIARVLAQFERQRPRYAVASARLAARLGITVEDWERLARLAAASHDTAKLAQGWQDGAWRWQNELHGTPRAGYLAHTDQDRSDPEQRRRMRDPRYALPGHAAEGAYAVGPALQAAVDAVVADQEAAAELARALFSAIARHHGAGTSHLADFALPSAARQEAARTLAEFGLQDVPFDDHPPALEREQFGDWLTTPQQEGGCFLAYWYVARRLRLADQRATAEANR